MVRRRRREKKRREARRREIQRKRMKTRKEIHFFSTYSVLSDKTYGFNPPSLDPLQTSG